MWTLAVAIFYTSVVEVLQPTFTLTTQGWQALTTIGYREPVVWVVPQCGCTATRLAGRPSYSPCSDHAPAVLKALPEDAPR